MGKKLDTHYERIYFVNHSHIDHTWWNSPEVCRERNETIINRMLELCSANPEFKFSYETTASLMDYLEKHPERKMEIAQLLRERRLDIGGLFVSANADACSEEAIARNFYYGKRWLEETFGYSPAVAKELDAPGHPLQMPQLVKSAGMDTLMISRGPQGGFRWKGPDGSEVLVYCVPYNWSYWRKLGVSFEEAERNLPRELERAAGRHAGRCLIVPDGDDMTLPNDALPEIIKRWNEVYDRPSLLLSTYEDFIGAIRRRKFSVRSGDMPNVWVGIHCLQVVATRDMKTLQNLLPCTEMLYALLCVLENDFGKYPAKDIDTCWRRVLLVGDHNWGGKDETRHGAEGDAHKERLARGSLRDCQGLIERGFVNLSKMLFTGKSVAGMPVIVFNPLSWERDEVVSLEIECGIPGLEGVEIVDHAQKPVPFAIDVVEKHPDDTIYRARADFLCQALPPVGYVAYYTKPMLEHRDSPLATEENSRLIENEFYRVEFSEDGGHLKSLYDKELGFELAGTFKVSLGPFEFDFGMFELFGIGLKLTVPDQGFFENPENEGTGESIQPTGEIWRACDSPAAVKVERRSGFRQALVAEGEFIGSRRRQEVVLYEGLKRVDLRVELDWRGKPDVAVYLQMPNSLMHGRKFIDTPFAVHREGNELADFWLDESLPVKFKVRGVQDWLCFENEKRGMAIATTWPIIDFTMVPAFPLMWTNNASGFFFGERYLQSGKHFFSFRLTSYDGTWLENNIHLWGKQLAKPPLTYLSEGIPSESRHSFASVDAANIVISAFKKAHGEDAIVVRLYEIGGKKTETLLRTSFPIKRARLTNIIETTSARLSSEPHSVKLSFRPFEVKTVKLYL
ncbi:MAG: hypothetical protein C4532_19990 [Candidatus Abyssobacteria bacterium SURF_17]|uniref:Glycoside hydrolase family 38 N-terminal domain-containing protein n=1 Tax=Candidatus Abyssobacteria bacterium SURF_17 TaxID=2093361 RepID=A0A419EN65_9BACT|nr:MAG: hypothetical protein C4532_19990 [Candidatus Abyssubacteria bacterium SURF_17]